MQSKGHFRLLIFFVFALLVSSTVAVVILRSPTPARAATSNSGLHVSGYQILNSSGQVVRPLGVNRAGAEYMCDASGDNTVFDDGANPNSAGQTGAALDTAFNAASISAFQSWDIQAVRITINEDCGLGINGYPAAQYTAATYQQTLVNYANGIFIDQAKTPASSPTTGFFGVFANGSKVTADVAFRHLQM